MDSETEYNTELTKLYHTNYVRNNRAIIVLWAIFSVIFLVLNIVVFSQPQWIGDDGDSAVAGFFGLWRYCEEITIGDDFVCQGDFLEWGSIINEPFQAASVMVGVSCLFFIVCVCAFFLFCLLKAATVLRVCGVLQLLSGVLMLASCLIYPVGWDDQEIRVVCGLQADIYDLGVCEMRWGYVLAIVLVLDAFILCTLAFVLAARQAKRLQVAYKEDKEPIKE